MNEEIEPLGSHAIPSRSRTAKIGLTGALLGAGALVGSLMVFSGGAGADPETSTNEVDAVVAEDVDVAESDDYEAFDQCLNEALGIDETMLDDADVDEDVLEGTVIDVDDAAIDEAFDDCASLLPEEEQAEIAAWEEFDQCLADNGLADDLEFDDDSATDTIFVESGDTVSAINFGNGDGSVTVTKTGDQIDITNNGDTTVETIDFEAIEELESEAFAACEDLAPEDLFDDEFGDFEEFADDDMPLDEFPEDEDDEEAAELS